MIASIPFPPWPSWPVLTWLGIAGGTFVAGGALLFWGRVLGRLFWALVGAGAGLACGPGLAAWVGANVLATRLAAAVTLALLGVVLGPVLWALLAGALAGGVALYFVVDRALQQAGGRTIDFELASPTLEAYVPALADHCLKCVQAAWRTDGLPVILAAGLAGGLPLVVGLLRRRLATIMMSSLLGAAGLVGGLAWACALLVPSLEAVFLKHWYGPAGAAAGAAVLGIVLQYRKALKVEKTEKQREGEPPPKPVKNGARP